MSDAEAPNPAFDHGGASLRDAWDAQAEAWIRWARTPGHDDFYERYNLPAFLELLPSPGRLTVDVGCGEGRVGRVLEARGHRVVGVEPAHALAVAARRAAARPETVRAAAGALPFPGAVADLVVSFMVLQDVDDLERAVAELARVLDPRGVICLALLHPIVSAGFFDPDEPVFYLGRYLTRSRYELAVDRDDVPFTFHGAHRPLDAYGRAFEAAGLLVEALREPALPVTHLAARPELANQRFVPNFLHLRLRKAVHR